MDKLAVRRKSVNNSKIPRLSRELARCLARGAAPHVPRLPHTRRRPAAKADAATRRRALPPPSALRPPPSVMAFLGALWVQRGSPYSLQAHWAIIHSHTHATLVPALPLLSTLLLWFRLGFPSTPVSLPVLLPPTRGARPVRDSSGIARLADALRPESAPPLFPPRAIVDIDRAMRAAATVAQYGRGRLLSAMASNRVAAAEIVLPRFLRTYLPFLVPLLLSFIRSRLLAKYPHIPTRDDVREALRSVRAALAKSNSGYICADGFTFADITVCACMFFAVTRRPCSPADRVFGDDELAKEFDDLIQWRAGVFKAHHPASERDAYNCVPVACKSLQ